MKRTATALLLLLNAPAAFAASEGATGPFGWLMDPVTNTAFLALVVFLLIVWRAGGFKTITSGLDNRAAAIQAELDQAKDLREAAAKALADAERKQQAADEDAKAIVAQAKSDAKSMMETARKDLEQRLKRREALAEARIARAEVEASEEVRRTAADAATQAARTLLSGDNGVDQFERAAAEIEKTFD